MFYRQAFLVGFFVVLCASFTSTAQSQTIREDEKTTTSATVRAEADNFSQLESVVKRLEAQVSALGSFLTSLNNTLASNPPRPKEPAKPPIPETLKIQLRIELADNKQIFEAVGYAADNFEISLPLVVKLKGGQNDQTGVGTLTFKGAFKRSGDDQNVNLEYQISLNTPFVTGGGQSTLNTGAAGSTTLIPAEEKVLGKTSDYSVWIKVDPDK